MALSQAATLTWTGLAGDGNVNTPGNWSPAQAPTTGDVLVIAGSTSLTPQEAVNLSIGSISFGSTASAFTFGGAGIYTMGANGITNNSAATQTINNAITLGAAQTWTANNGALSFGGAITNAGFLLTVDGAFNTTISNSISGTGGLTKNGTGTLTLSGANAYTGATTINAGTVTLDYTTVGSKLADTSVLALGGGTLNLTNGASAHNEVVASTTINSGASSVTRTSGTSVLRMNAITRVAGGTINFGAANIADTDRSNTNGILGGWATVGGANWAVSAASAADTAITALASYTAFGTSSTTTNQLITSAGTTSTTGTYNTNSLKIAPTGPGGVLSLGGSSRRMTISSGGLLFVGANNYTISATQTANTLRGPSGGELIIQQFGTGNLTISAVIVNNGTSGLLKAGPGTLTLSGTNTYTGLTTVSAGTLLYGKSNVISTGGITVNGPTAILNLGASQTDTVGTVTVDGGGSITGTGTSALTSTGTFAMKNGSVSAILAGTGIVLNKTTTGTVTLSGANTYTGATTISAGSLKVRNNTGLGTTAAGTTVASGAVLQLDGTLGNLTIGAETLNLNGSGLAAFPAGALSNIAGNNSYAGAITLAGASTIASSVGTTLTLSGGITNGGFLATFDGAGNTNVTTAVITGTGGLTKTGPGTLTLSSANTYSGVTTISAGTLVAGASSLVSTNGAFGNAASAIVLGDTATSLDNSSAALMIGGAFTVSRDINIANQATTGIYMIGGNTASSSTFSGAIALNKNLTISAVTGGTVNLTKSISNASGANTVDITGAGTSNVVLNNATANQFAPTLFTVSSGKLSLGASNQIADATNLTVIGGTFDIGANSDTVGAVNLASGSITGTSGTLTGTSYSLTNTGAISAILGGSGVTLTKTGAGTVTLSGANSYTGLTDVQAGTLSLGRIGGTIADTAAVQVSGGTLDVANSDTVGAVTLSSGTISGSGTLTGTSYSLTNTGAISAIFGGSGVTLTKTGAGTVILSGANSYTGLTDVQAGTLSLGRIGGTIADTAAVQVSGGTLDVANSDTVGSVTLSSGTISGSGTLTGTSYSLTNTGTISAILAGAGSMTKSGAGTVVLTGANTFGGAGQTVSINGGSLQVGADNNLGDSANNLTFNGGMLSFSGGVTTSRNTVINAGGGTIDTANNAVTFAAPGVISGVGALTKVGTGTLTLTGSNTYQGGTILNAGKLSITSDGNLGTGNMQLNNGTTLVTNGSFNFTHGFVLGAPSGALQGDGLAVSGIVDVQSGTLTMTTNGITDGGAGGRLMKIGAGTLDLTVASPAFGGNTLFSGGTYIHEGTLIVTSIGALGTNQVTTFDNGATLIGNLNVGGMVSVNQFKIGTGGALSGQVAGKTAFVNGVISNVSGQSGGITFIGPGKAGMGGNNTFVGTVVIGNPATPLVPMTLSISRDVNLGAASNQLTIGNGSTLMIEDGIDATQPAGSAAIAATFSMNRQINLTGTTATIDVRNTGDAVNYNPAFSPGLNTLAPHVNVLTVNGVITGSAQLIKSGPGTLVLTNTGNNYTGGTTINGGILSISDPAALGLGTAALTINPTGILQATGSFSSARTVTLGGTGGASSGGTFEVTGTNNETRTGVISGSGSLTKTGTGTLTLTAANTFTGDFYINGGTVSTTSNQALGPQPPSLGSALYTVHMANGTTLQTVINSAVGSRQFELVSGTVTFDVTGAFTQQRNGLIYGAGGLTKAGTGTLILTNANTYTGGTIINNGIFQVNNPSGSVTGTGAVTVNSGGTLSGLPTANGFTTAGSISGAVTVNSGGTLLARSGTTLTLGSLTLNTSAISDFQLGSLTVNPLVNITDANGLSLAGASTIDIFNFGGLAAGTYTLFDYTGTAFSSISNLSLVSTPGGGFTYSLSNNAGNTSIDLLVSTSTNQWANDVSGNWSASGNWAGGVPNSLGAQANFFGVISQARTVTVDGAFTAGSMTFNDANAYTIAGDGVGGHGLTLSNGGTAFIEVLDGSHTITAPIALTDHLKITTATGTAITINAPISENSAGRTVQIDGAGTTTLGGSAANTYTGLTTVIAGTLNLNKTAAVNAIGTGGVQVNSGATLALLASDQILDTATVTVNGTFALGTFSETIGALSGFGNLATGTGSVLTVGASNNLSSQFDGVISGAGSMTKSGAGTVVLTGANTFGGAGQTVSINGGSLQVGADNNLGDSANNLTFNGGMLSFSGGVTTSRNTVINAGGGTIDTANNAVTFAAPGVISGVGALTKVGTGTLTLTGSNTYQGGTILNAGKLSITSDGNLGTGNMQLNNGTTLVTNGSFNFTHGFVLGAPSGALQGDGLAVSGIVDVQSGTLTMTTNGITDGGAGGRLMKIGAGTLDLTVASPAFGGNTLFSGGTYIHEGTLMVSAIGALGSNPVTTFDNGATLLVNVNAGGLASVAQFKIGTGGAVVGETAGKTSFSNGAVSNVSGQAGGITFVGPGKSGMGGNNTFVGTVVIGNPSAPLVPVTLSISRDANLGAASNQLTIGNGSTLMIEDGIDATQPAGSAAIAATFSMNRQINLTGTTATIDVRNTGDAVNYNPAFTPGLNTLAPHVNVLTVNGAITGSAQLIKSGPGTLVLNNAGNNYTGGTTINGGILSISNSAALGLSTGVLTINPTGIYQSTATFTTSRAVVLGGTGGAGSGGTIDITGSNNETRTGVISGNGSLTKTGTGTLTLTAVNTFTGLTVVNAGELDLNTTAGQSIAGDVTVNGGMVKLLQASQINSAKNLVVSGGIFNIQGFNQALANVQLTGGSITGTTGVLTSANAYDMQAGVVSAILAGGVALNKTTSGTVTLSGANTYSGGTVINGGTLTLTGVSGLGATTGALAVNNTNTGAGNGTVLNLSATAATTTGSLSGTIATPASGVNTATINNGGQSFTVNQTVAGTFAGVIAGSGSFTLGGLSTNTLTFTGSNTYTGLTLVSAGELDLNTTAGQSIAGNVTVSGGTVKLLQANQINSARNLVVSSGVFNLQGFNQTVANVQLTGGSITGTTGILTSANTYDMQAGVVSAILAGSVALNKTTGGTVTLSGANTYNGGATLNAGQLNINNASALGTGTFTINGGTVNNTSGGAITLSTNNTQNWNGDFIFTGSNALNLGTGAVNLNATSQVTVSANTLTVGGIISGSAGLTKAGGGILTLTGMNTYTGLTTVNAGELDLNTSGGVSIAGDLTISGGTAKLLQGNQIDSSINLVVSGGTLDLQGFGQTVGSVQLTGGSIIGTTGMLTSATDYDMQAGSVTVALGGTDIGLNKTGVGTVALSGGFANTFTGLTTVSEGELDLNKTAGVNAITGAGLQDVAIPDVLIAGGILKWLANEQVADTATISMSSGTFNLNGKTENIAAFTNSGGTFVTGAGHLIGTGTTITWSGGTNTINDGGLVEDQNLVLSGGTNIVQGGTTGGVLQLNSGGAGLEMTGASLTLNSDNSVAGSLVLKGDVSVHASGTSSQILSGLSNTNAGNVNLFGGTRTFTVDSGATLAVGAIITNGSLTKVGAGTMTLSAVNIYTGATNVNGGTLALDYTTVSSKLADTSTLALGGGTLNLLNGASSHVEVVASTTLNIGASSVTRTSGTSVLRMNAITRNVGSTVNFGAASIADTDTSNVNGIIGGYATVGGNTWAVSATGASDTLITGLASYSANNGSALGGALNNTDMSGGDTSLGAGGGTTNSIRFNNAVARTITDSGTLTVTSGGILVTSAVGNFLSSITGGTLMGAAGKDLIINQYNTSNGFTIASTIADNTTATGLTKSGAGLLTLSNTSNTYTGKTYLNAGTTNIAADLSLGAVPGAFTGDQLTFNGGTLQFGAAGITIAANRGVTFLSNGGTFDTSVNSGTVGGVITGSGALTKIGANTLTLTGANTYTGGAFINAGVLALGSSGALGSTGAISFGGGTLQYSASNTTDYSTRFSTAAGQAYNVDTNGQDVTFDGALTSSAGTFTKSGTGKLTLNNDNNTYSGNTTVNSGTMQIDGVITSAVAVNSGATLSGTGSVSKAITINGLGALRPGNKTPTGSGIGTFTLSNSDIDVDLTVATNGTLGLQLGANGIAFANQATTYYSSPGVLNAAYLDTANLQANANDRIIVGGTLTLVSGSIIDVTLNGYTPSLGDGFDLGDWTALTPGGFTIGPGTNLRTGADNGSYDLNLPDLSTINSSYRWDVSLFASEGIIVVVVPEPSRVILLMAGFAACFLRRRRNRAFCQR